MSFVPGGSPSAAHLRKLLPVAPADTTEALVSAVFAQQWGMQKTADSSYVCLPCDASGFGVGLASGTVTSATCTLQGNGESALLRRETDNTWSCKDGASGLHASAVASAAVARLRSGTSSVGLDVHLVPREVQCAGLWDTCSGVLPASRSATSDSCHFSIVTVPVDLRALGLHERWRGTATFTLACRSATTLQASTHTEIGGPPPLPFPAIVVTRTFSVSRYTFNFHAKL